MKRHAESHLLTWKNKQDRKPLILRGARQVGKTTLVEQFSASYKHFLQLNLERPEDLTFFEQFTQARVLVEALFLSRGIHPSEMKDTLLFLDEVQSSPGAIQLLRYLYEDVPELHVIAAGSLLEFAIKEVKSFPVGRVEYLFLHPMNFGEYLEACDNSRAFEQLQTIPVNDFAHEVLINLFHKYAIIGGMPEVVKTHLESNSIASLPSLYEGTWGAYKDDVEKYGTTKKERLVIRHIMETAPFFLDKRVKFQNFGNSNYQSREVKEAFLTLEKAKVIRLIRPVTEVVFPPIPSLRKAPRLQFLDTGILNYALGIQSEMLAMNDLSSAYKGVLIPHLITQELLSLNHSTSQNPNFWVREKNQSSAEVDLLIAQQSKMIPIEIKSGKVGTLRSLHEFIDRSGQPYAVRIYGGKFSIQKHITRKGTPYLLMNLPYYLGTQLKKYVEWFVESY